MQYKDKMMLIFYRAVLLVILTLIIWFIIGMVNNYIILPQNKRKIKDDLSIYHGAIVKEIKSAPKISDLHRFTYSFQVLGETITSNNNIGISFKSNSAHYLMEKSLPVAYETNNPKNSRLLIMPEDFEFFGILFPDSLQWIKEDVLE